MKKTSKKDFLFAGLWLAATIFSVWKASRGFGNIDESFYLTVPYRILRGDALIVNEWHLSQLSGVLLLPFMFLYQAIFHTNEGIILAFRYIYIAVQMLLSAYIYSCVRERKGALPAVAVFMIYAPFNIMALSYNSMGIQALAAALASLCGDCPGRRKMFLSGLFFAAAVLCNPYLVLIYAVYAAFCLFFVFRKKANLPLPVFRKSKFFFFTGGCAALAVPTVMLLLKSSLKQLLGALSPIMADPEHPAISLLDKFSAYIREVFFSNAVAPAVMLGFALLFILWLFDCRAFNGKYRDCIFFMSLLLTVVFVFGFLLSDFPYVNFFPFPVCIAGLFAFITAAEKKRNIFALFWLPAMVYTFLLHCTSNQGFYAISSASAVAAIPSVLLIIYRMSELPAEKITSAAAKAAVAAAIGMTCISLAGTRLYYTFWDETVDKLPVKIENGVNAGIRTTQAKAEAYESLVNDTELIRSLDGKNVLYYSLEACLYLMDAKQMAAYSAWLSISDNTPERLSLYYELCPDKTPDCIYLSKTAGIAPEELLERLALTGSVTEGELGYTLVIGD